MSNENKIYLGDGVYVEYTGHDVILSTSSNLFPDSNIIHLELGMVKSLNLFIERQIEMRKKGEL